MIDFSGKVVTIVGRLASVSSERAVDAVTAVGGVVRRGQPRHGGVLVIARLAFRQLERGGLRRRIQAADAAGARCVSETMFLEALGLVEPGPAAAGVVDLEQLPSKTGLDIETLRLLILFDVIHPRENQCSFRDLVAAREVARLLGEGINLGDVIEGANRIAGNRPQRRLGPFHQDQPLARLRLVSDQYGRIVHQIGSALADLDGQLRLPLPDADNPSIDELFEAAEEAEWLGELPVAAKLYQRCIRLDRKDPIAPFNLANVLRESDDVGGAVFHLRVALGLDPHFADAWYNLALIMDGKGEKRAAMEGFERAIEADPNYADPIYNLAQLYFDDGSYREAERLWTRYLALDCDSEWSRRARYGIALCRRQQEQRG
ncbi:MAG: tetratricopeptide repeat protein [Alphaproteobacteria bacterium]|nr:tetratricopeptide repeat protein [Alphaproteobacteria bacterium]